jgi:PEP-CTERM motif
MTRITSCLLAFCVLPAAAQATTLLNENFDELTPQLSATSVGAFSAIDGTNVDIVGGGLFGSLCVAPESGNCVDMNGSGGNPQGILRSNSSFTLQPGVDYFLSFDLIGSQRGGNASTTVNFGPYSQTFALASSNVTSGIVTNHLITVSAPTTTFLTFTSNIPGDEGTLLDNVMLTSGTPVSTPEPATLGLLAFGLAAAGFAGRKRRK